MNLAGGRYPHLVATLAGYLKTNTPLIQCDGTTLLPCVTNDDIGIYLFIPKIAKFFNITLAQAINFFFYGIMFASFALGLAGFLFLYPSLEKRAVSLVGLAGIVHLMCSIGDVYCIGPACATALAPTFLYLLDKQSVSRLFQCFLVFAGIFIGFSNYLRAYCGIPMLLFIAILVLCALKHSIKTKLQLICLLFAGLAIPTCYVHKLCKEYESYAQKNLPYYKQIKTRHPFLHTLYCSFGFLNTMNEDHIEFSDHYAHEKIRAINPNVANQFDDGYDDLVKKELIKLWQHQRFFVLLTLFAKLGVLLFFLLKYANFGLLAALLYPKNWSLELAFFAMLGFNALYVIAAIPLGVYTINFMVTAILYGIVSINHAFDDAIKRFFLFIKRFKAVQLKF